MLRRTTITVLLVAASVWHARPASAQASASDTSRVLGTREAPVRTDGPRGQHEYLARLRCPSGASPSFVRLGSLGSDSPDGHTLDEYEVQCESAAARAVIMDMYHRGYREMHPVPGFTVLPDIPARVAPGCPPQVVADPDSAARYVFGELEVERPAHVRRPFDPLLPVEVGIEGRAYVAFVLDTLGRPEPGTLNVLYLSDERLRPHVEPAVARIPFLPAEHRPGCRVRQRMAGPIEFR